MLYSAIHHGYFLISLIAVLASVVSAVYYMKEVKVLYLDEAGESSVDLTK